MTDAFMWDEATDDGGPWLDDPHQDNSIATGRGNSPNRARRALERVLTERFHAWHTTGYRWIDELAPHVWEAHIRITRQEKP